MRLLTKRCRFITITRCFRKQLLSIGLICIRLLDRAVYAHMKSMRILYILAAFLRQRFYDTSEFCAKLIAYCRDIYQKNEAQCAGCVPQCPGILLLTVLYLFGLERCCFTCWSDWKWSAITLYSFHCFSLLLI